MSLVHRLDAIHEILMEKLNDAQQDSDFDQVMFAHHVQNRFGVDVADDYRDWFDVE